MLQTLTFWFKEFEISKVYIKLQRHRKSKNQNLRQKLSFIPIPCIDPFHYSVSFTHNSLFLIVIQIYKIWYIFGEPLGTPIIICKKNCKFSKSSFSVKIVQIQKVHEHDKKYLFEKPLTLQIQISKNICIRFKN